MLPARVFLRYVSLDEVRVQWLEIFSGELEDARKIARKAGPAGRIIFRRYDGIWEILRQRGAA